MRDDMFKVIVERPRWGSRHAPAAKLKRGTHPDRKFIGLKRHAWESASYTKSLSENLAPLKRYLMKQRGRIWNDVFSEICSELDTGSTVKMHIREHVADFIMVNIHVNANGHWIGQDRWQGARPLDEWWPDLYVDPFDGLVKETSLLCNKLGIVRKARYRWQAHTPQGPFDDFKRLASTQAFWMRNGLWFELRLTADPKCSSAQLREELIKQAWRDHGRWEIRSIKQLSRKELKISKLANNEGAF